MANLGLTPQALFCRPLRGLRAPGSKFRRLLRRDGRIVYHKRSRQRRVFHTQEVDPDRLALKRSDIERP